MEKKFETGVAEIIQASLINELKQVEQEMLQLSNRRQLLKSAIAEVKGERPADYKEPEPNVLAPVRPMFSKKFEDNESMSSRINFILAEKKAPLTAAEITDLYIKHLPEFGKGKKREKLIKNISTILSIGNEKRYARIKSEDTKKFAYKLILEEATA